MYFVPKEMHRKHYIIEPVFWWQAVFVVQSGAVSVSWRFKMYTIILANSIVKSIGGMRCPCFWRAIVRNLTVMHVYTHYCRYKESSPARKWTSFTLS